MSNVRTAENYFSIGIKQFKELLKIDKTVRFPYTFTRSRTRGGEKEILHQEEVEVILNGETNYMFLGGRRILIETTPCNYGNKRYWFGCPICEGRTTKLFLHGGAYAIWKCRKCANLVYRSQQETKGDFGRGMTKLKRSLGNWIRIIGRMDFLICVHLRISYSLISLRICIGVSMKRSERNF